MNTRPFYKVMSLDFGYLPDADLTVIPGTRTFFTYRKARRELDRMEATSSCDTYFKVWKFYGHRAPRPVGPTVKGWLEC